MKVMAIDCEFNQPSRKCIQIGAAIYDANTGYIVDQFETYVNPGEPISQAIVELTGITDNDVRNAPNISQAFKMLEDFYLGQKRVFRNPLVWGSGYRNDSQVIHEEAKTGKDNFMGFRVIDVKTIFQSIQIFRESKLSANLEDTCEYLKIGFEGKKHTALADAKNTFRVWHYLMTRFGQLK